MTFNGQHRALALLARSPNGRTETFMFLHGCTRQYLDGLIRVGFATATKERVGRGRRIEIARVKITEAGRAALSKPYARSRHSASGTTASLPRIKQANGKARTNGGRPSLITEIMTLSPPSPGCERRARLILRKFTLNELQVLVKALRDGIAGDLKVALHLRDWELSGNHSSDHEDVTDLDIAMLRKRITSSDREGAEHRSPKEAI